MDEYRMMTAFGLLGGSPDTFSLTIHCCAYKKIETENDSEIQEMLIEGKWFITFQCENRNHYDDLWNALAKIPRNSVILVSAVLNEGGFEQAKFIKVLTPLQDEIAFFEKYNVPVIVTDPKTGVAFTLNKQFDCYEGNIRYNGVDINITLEDIIRDMKVLHFLIKDFHNFVANACIFAAKKLNKLAIDWSDADDESGRNYDENPITEDEFARRIKLQSITTGYIDGDYTLWFDDDNLFLGHGVSVSGNIETGFVDSRME